MRSATFSSDRINAAFLRSNPFLGNEMIEDNTANEQFRTVTFREFSQSVFGSAESVCAEAMRQERDHVR